jgi:hypothetical protein
MLAVVILGKNMKRGMKKGKLERKKGRKKQYDRKIEVKRMK